MAAQLAKAIALPGKTAPVRFPSFPALERTATMAFNASIPYSLSTGDTHVMLTRSALFPVWGDVQNGNTGAASQALTYGAVYSCVEVPLTSAITTAETIDTTVVDMVGAWSNTTNYGINAPSISNKGGLWPVTDRPVLGWDPALGDVPFVYVPAGASVMVTVAGVAHIINNGRVTMEVWDAPGVATYSTLAPGTIFATTTAGYAAGQTFQVATSQWLRPVSLGFSPGGTPAAFYSPTISLGVSVSNTVPSFTSGANTGVWNVSSSPDSNFYFLPLTSSPEFNNSVLPWSATRLTALAALFTNTTKVLNKEGTVLWGRTNPMYQNSWLMSKSVVQTLHPAEKAFLGIEQGTYAYNPPSTDLEFFTSYVRRVSPGLTSTNIIPVFNLGDRSMDVHGYFSDPDGGTNFALNIDYHIEFRTSSTLFNIAISNHTLEALHSAQLSLLKAGFFFTNFDHVALIGKIISGMSAAYPLLNVASPMLKGLYRSTRRAAKQSGVSVRPITQDHNPNPTSARASGITQSSNKAAAAQLPPFKMGAPGNGNWKTMPNPRSRKATRRGKNGRRGGLSMYLQRKR